MRFLKRKRVRHQGEHAMNHAVNAGEDVGLGQDERSVLTDMEPMDANDHSGPVQQLLGVLGEVQEMAQAVSEGNAGGLWSDECMNQLIMGVELSLSQGWGEVLDGFTDTGRILQSYENADRAEDAAPFLQDSYELLCAMVTDSMNGSVRPKIQEQWRARYQAEVDRLQERGLSIADDDASEFGADEGSSEETPFEFPDLNASKLGQLSSNDDDLPTLDELPPLESMLSGESPSADQRPAATPAEPPRHVAPEDDELAETFEEDAKDASADTQPDDEDEVAEAVDVAVSAGQSAQPSRTVVEFVDRICEELAGLSQRDEDERMLSMEMIQGGVAALKREALKDEFSGSAELCDEMMKAILCMGQSDGPVDERLADLGFGFCGVYVEAMNNPASENVTEWRSECIALIEEWAETMAIGGMEEPSGEERVESPAPEAQDVEPEQIGERVEHAEIDAAPDAAEVEVITSASEEDVLEMVAEAAEEATANEADQVAATETPAAPVSPSVAPSSPAGTLESQDLFARAQEALSRGDGEAAKALALQAAAMIAETEVEKAEQHLRDAEARLKANINATEEARSEVKHSEKLVMNAASDVAAGETNLGKAKSHTAKSAHDVEETEAEVAEIERQIAELQAKLEEQMQEVGAAKARLDDARQQEGEAEAQVDGLREAEKEARKNLEAARQRVKDFQRVISEIESEMEQARENLSRQRSSLTDINQTINRPEPIKTDDGDGEDSLLF